MNLTSIHPIHWTTKPAAFIQSVAAINPNVIVLLNVGSAIIVEDWMASAKAIIQTFYPGQEGGTAVAALLFGDSNFSGKLPFTVGQNESDYPQFQNSGPQPPPSTTTTAIACREKRQAGFAIGLAMA